MSTLASNDPGVGDLDPGDLGRGDQDIVVTGMGLITALGLGLDAHRTALAADKTGVTRLPDAPDGSPMALAAQIKEPYLRVDVPDDLESQLKFLNPAGELAVNAALEAITQAGFPEQFKAIPPERRSLYLAQVDCTDWACRAFRAGFVAAAPDDGETWDAVRINKMSTRRTKPFFLLEGLKNNVFSFLGTWFELRGANTSVAGYAHAGFHAMDRAVRALKDGVTDVALVVGAAHTTEPLVRGEMGALGLVEKGPKAVPGDGAGALVLERRATANARGATVLATWKGSAARSGPATDYRPASETIAAAMQAAGAPARLDGIGVPVAFEPADYDAGTPDHRPFGRAVGHLSAAKEAVDVILSIVSANPGETWAVLSYGLFGQVGAVVLERPA